MANEENTGPFPPHRFGQHDDGSVSMPFRDWLANAGPQEMAALMGFAVLFAQQLDAAPAGESVGETVVRVLIRHGYEGETHA